MKVLFLDVETTGTNPEIHAIHQISGQIIIDDVVKEIFDFKVRPHKGAIADPKALEIGGVTRADLKSYPTNDIVHKELTALWSKYVSKFDKLDKFFFYAYNAKFDSDFMWSFFRNADDKFFGSYVWSGSIDVMVLAAERLKSIRHTLPNFKLMTVAAALGIKVDESKLHDSQYDIELTKDIYNIIMAPVCYCGAPASERFAPCCSSDCFHSKYDLPT